MKTSIMITTLWLLLLLACSDDPVKKDPDEKDPHEEEPADFYFGADLSYVNQVLDHGGIYKDGGEVRNPYRIFKDHGTNLVRLRLWHNPAWTKEVYGAQGTHLYNDLADVERSIRQSKDEGMAVLLDLHYSDTWADPAKQEIPKAWMMITDIAVLKDSVYQYTFRTLRRLEAKGLMPEMVQIGNETNCGMLYTKAPAAFPACNVCNNHWERLGMVVNSAIQAVRDAAATSAVKTKVLLHVADPKNVDWWFDNVTASARGNVKDFDIIGFSYYPLWHTTVSLDNLSTTISGFTSKYGKPVMILETAYPWTTSGDDSYNNVFGGQPALSGYPYTPQGQRSLMTRIVQEVKDGGGAGVIYWEPAWVSCNMKDLWGTGSSWENNAFFDFEGNVGEGIEYMSEEYR